MANDKQFTGNPHEWSQQTTDLYLEPITSNWLLQHNIKPDSAGSFSLSLDQVRGLAMLGFTQCSKVYNEGQFGIQQNRQTEEVQAGVDAVERTGQTQPRSTM